jgi:hypothetical protein
MTPWRRCWPSWRWCWPWCGCPGTGTGIRHHCCATGEEFKGRRDVPSGLGSPVWCVRALRVAPRCRPAEALASVSRRAVVLRRTTSWGTDGARRPEGLRHHEPPAGGANIYIRLGAHRAPRRIVRAPQPTAHQRLPQRRGTYCHVSLARAAAPTRGAGLPRRHIANRQPPAEERLPRRAEAAHSEQVGTPAARATRQRWPRSTSACAPA